MSDPNPLVARIQSESKRADAAEAEVARLREVLGRVKVWIDEAEDRVLDTLDSIDVALGGTGRKYG